jgi:GT2 family glycosyltransferase
MIPMHCFPSRPLKRPILVLPHTKFDDSEHASVKDQTEISEHSRVSVIIPTKNRASDLALTVHSLRGQTILPAQIVIVDQSSDDVGFLKVKAELADVPCVQLDYVRDTSIQGAATARNCAMEHATGDTWLFLDDDVVMEPDFIEQLLAVYRNYPKAEGVSGIITNYRPPPLPIRLWTAIFARGPFRDERQPIYWAADQLKNADPIPVRQFTSALMSFQASTIRGMRFDSNLTGAWAEDTDFCWRLPVGTVMLIAPRARLIHNRSLRGRSADHWLRAHSQSAYYLYEKNRKYGIKNRFCFQWLNVGYGVALAGTCVKRRSLEGWRALRGGRSAGRAFAKP